VDIDSGVLQIACDDQFRSSQLRAASNALKERFNAFFGVPIRYEFVVNESSITEFEPTHISSSSSSSADRTPRLLFNCLSMNLVQNHQGDIRIAVFDAINMQ